MKVLIVEDDTTSARMVEAILSHVGGECDSVRDGESAYERFCEAYEGGEPYDLVCLDLHLPEADGVEFLNGIRQYEELQGLVASEVVKVVVISGDKETRSVYDAMTAGCTSYLVKPLDRKKFLDELSRLGFPVKEGASSQG